MDLERLEHQLHALGGADTITVNDLSETDVTRVKLDLAGRRAADGQADTVIINGTTATM